MKGLQEFHFCWGDAWGRIGFETLLERSLAGTCRLLSSINSEKMTLEFDEQAFIKELDRIKIYKWDHYLYYRSNIMDGDHWKLSATYNDLHMESEGMNGYPPGFLEFLQLLHSIGCPKLYCEQLVTTKSIGQSKKNWIEHSTWSSYVDFNNF